MKCTITCTHNIGLALGLLASNATLISDSFNMSEVFMVLSETIRDNFRNSKLKQSLLPCLGEFLFYAATQEESEGKVNENWEVPGSYAHVAFGSKVLFYCAN